MTAFDRLLTKRALAYGALGFALVLSIMLLTEESFSTWPQRVARLCVFAPAVAAIASALSLAQARARGELGALAALGVTPLRVARGPSVAAWAVGVVAVVLVASPAADLSAVFPALKTAARWTATQRGFFEAQHGVWVDAERALRFVPAPGASSAFAGVHELAGALAVGPLAVVLPVWVASAIGPWLRAAAVLVALALLLVLLHAVAAGRLGAPWLAAVTAPLLLQIAGSRRRRACP